VARWTWYAVKTLYRTSARGRPVRRDANFDPKATLIEERVVLIRARSFDEAIRRGEDEAREYASGPTYCNPYGQRVTTKYLEVCDAFNLFNEPANRHEVYSRTEIVTAEASAAAVIKRLFGADEPDGGDHRRRKFEPG
jgi:Domain of unknown function (DUF4288)